MVGPRPRRENGGMDTPNDFQTTVRQMWDTRPPRIPKDQGGNALLGGVCEGIGARYRIDPVLVRIMFVVLGLAFGGGIFAYFLCWMNMPRFGMTVSPGRAIATPKDQLTPIERKERSAGWWLVLGLVVFFPSVSYAGDLRAVVVTAIVLFGAWYLAHRSVPQPPAGLLPSQGALPGDAAVDTSHLTPPEGYPHPGVGTATPPAWDPLGAAPELWHLPDPGPAEPARPAPKASQKWVWIPIGVGIAALTAAVLSTAGSDGAADGSASSIAGDISLAPTSEEGLEDVDSSLGDISLDLSELPALDQPRTIEVSNHLGDIRITLPENAKVKMSCSSNMGSVDCPSGVINADAPGELLELHVSNNLGDTTVTRP